MIYKYEPNSYFYGLQIDSNIVRCPDPEYAEKMIAAIDAVRVKGESVGGVVTCVVKNCPPVRLPLSLFSNDTVGLRISY